RRLPRIVIGRSQSRRSSSCRSVRVSNRSLTQRIVESTLVKFVKPLLIVLLSSLLLSACSTEPGAAAIADGKSRGDRNRTAQIRQVETIAAEEKPIDQIVVVTGTLAADQEVVLGFKVSGRLSDIPVDLGSSVQQGEPIARLDTTDFELRVRQADAAL